MTVGSVLLIVVAVVFLALGLGQGSNMFLVGSIGASLLAAVALIFRSRQAVGAGSPETEAGLNEVVDDAASSRTAPADRGAGQARQAGRTATMTEAVRATQPPTVLDSRGDGRQRDEPRVAEPDGDLLVVGRADPAPEPSQTQPARSEPARSEPARSEPARSEPARDESSTREAGSSEQLIPTQSVAADRDRLSDVPAEAAEPHDVDLLDEPAAEQMSPAEAARLATMTTDVLVVDGRPRYHLVGCAYLITRNSEPISVGEAVELGFTPCAACQPNVKLLHEAPRT